MAPHRAVQKDSIMGSIYYGDINLEVLYDLLKRPAHHYKAKNAYALSRIHPMLRSQCGRGRRTWVEYLI